MLKMKAKTDKPCPKPSASKWMLLLSLLGIVAGVAQAAITGYSGSASPQVGFPDDLSLDAVESDTEILVYCEREYFVLTEDLPVDITENGTYVAQSDLTAGSILAGAVIDCYLLHGDIYYPPGKDLSGSLTFDGPVLGVVVLTESLQASDGIVGRSGVTYETRPGSASGLELTGQDTVELAGGTVSFTLGLRGQMDELRIIVRSVRHVDVDIRPGVDPNVVNLRSQGVVPVAILSALDFDATTIDVSTVLLGGLAGPAQHGKKEKLMAREADVNRDGFIDLVVQIDVGQLEPGDLTSGSIEVTATTSSGQHLRGQDQILIVPQAE